MPVLRIKLPDNKGEITHVLAGERITIGRRPDNTIQIIDRTVSGHHAELISINGHYRLHDLGSTNLTCVEGQPVTDFHLHDACKVSFGTVECEFSPETPVNTMERSEVVPTRAELEYLRRENLDLQAKISAMQKQIDILSSARLMTKETQNLGVMPDVHRRVTQDRDEMKSQNAKLQLEVEHLRADVAALGKERDALRLAWETMKRERDETVAKLGLDNYPTEMGSAIGSSSDDIPADFDTTRSAPDHRAMAAVLTTAPSCLKSMRTALDALEVNGDDNAAGTTLSGQAETLAQALSPLGGHPAQRLAAVTAALIRDTRTRTGRIEASVVASLKQAAETIAGLLDPRAFKKAAEVTSARTLIVDDDQASLDSLSSSLRSSDFQSSRCTSAEQALELLSRERFDLVLLDVASPALKGADLCAKIREVPNHRQTPVIFMGNDVNGGLNGGDDFIVKPFNMLEVAMKASTWACRHQLGLKN